MDRDDEDYYRTYKSEIPNDEKAAEYIHGTHIGASDKEIPKLAKMIRHGEIPEKIMQPLRVLALNVHNSFIRYNIERDERFKAEHYGNERLDELLDEVDKLKELVTESMRIILNIQKGI